MSIFNMPLGANPLTCPPSDDKGKTGIAVMQANPIHVAANVMNGFYSLGH